MPYPKSESKLASSHLTYFGTKHYYCFQAHFARFRKNQSRVAGAFLQTPTGEFTDFLRPTSWWEEVATTSRRILPMPQPFRALHFSPLGLDPPSPNSSSDFRIQIDAFEFAPLLGFS